MILKLTNNYLKQAVVGALRDPDETATMGGVSDISLSREVARLSEMADIGEGGEDDDNGRF